MSQHPRFPLRVAVAITVLVVAAVVAWRYSSSATQGHLVTSAAVPDEAPNLRLTPTQWQSLDIQPVGTASFRTLAVADGVVSVDEDATVPVFSPANGLVLSVNVEPGQSVRAGQTLATIVGAETAQAGADVAAATAAARAARQQLELARAAVARQKGLVDAGGGATKDVLQAQSDLVAAEGAVQTSTAAAAAALAKAHALGATDAASPAASDALRLTAPIAGEVIQRQVAAGQLVASLASGAATPLFTVSDLRRVWVIASVGEDEGRRVKVGQPASVASADGTGPALSGTVAWVAPVVDPTSRRLAVRIVLANADLALKPQMALRVRVLDPHADKTTAVPTSAIVFDGAEAHCFVVSGMHTLVARYLELGRSEAGTTQVLSGVQPGERVVVHGALFVDTANANAGATPSPAS